MADKYGKKSKEELADDERYFQGIEYNRRNLFPVEKNGREMDNAKMYKDKMLRDETTDYKAKNPPSNALMEILGSWLGGDQEEREGGGGGESDTNENYQTAEGYEYDENGKKKPTRSPIRKLFGN